MNLGARPGPSGLRAALALVQANDTTRGYLEYGDGTAISTLVGQSADRFGPVEHVGLGGLRANPASLVRNVGLDPARMGTRLTAGGLVANSAGIMFGSYDVSKADAWFERNGGVRENAHLATRWRTGEDGETPDDDLVADGSFNVVHLGPDWFAWSSAGDSLGWFVEPGDATLAADETMTALADCLGDTVFAVIERMPSGVTYAVGMRIGQGTEVIEMVCARPPAADQVPAMVDNANRMLGSRPHMPGTTVEQAADVVVMSWRNPYFPTGTGLTMLSSREVGKYFEG